MAQIVTLPSLGFAILEATIIKWHKKEGDTVKKEEPIASMESDKVTYDVVSPMDGVLLKQLHRAGDTVKVDHPMAIVGKAGESPENAVPAQSVAEVAGTDAEIQVLPSAVNEVEPLKSSAGQLKSSTPPHAEALTGKVRATPAARNLCRKEGIDIHLVAGSCADGSVRREDVMKYIESHKLSAAAAASSAPTEQDEVIPLAGVRKSIAKALSNSYTNAVHVTTFVEVDMTDVDNLRRSLKNTFAEENIKLTFMPFFVQAAIKGIRQFPILNSAMDHDSIIVKKNIDFSIAVNTSKGLLLPVLKNAGSLGFKEIAKRLAEISFVAENGNIPPQFYGAGSISLSNAGSYGAVGSTPIIANGNSAVVWTGVIQDKPAVYKGEIVPRKLMNLCVSYDHRIMDGATVAQFLTSMKKSLENPALLIMG